MAKIKLNLMIIGTIFFSCGQDGENTSTLDVITPGKVSGVFSSWEKDLDLINSHRKSYQNSMTAFEKASSLEELKAVHDALVNIHRSLNKQVCNSKMKSSREALLILEKSKESYSNLKLKGEVKKIDFKKIDFFTKEVSENIDLIESDYRLVHKIYDKISNSEIDLQGKELCDRVLRSLSQVGDAIDKFEVDQQEQELEDLTNRVEGLLKSDPTGQNLIKFYKDESLKVLEEYSNLLLKRMYFEGFHQYKEFHARLNNLNESLNKQSYITKTEKMTLSEIIRNRIDTLEELYDSSFAIQRISENINRFVSDINDNLILVEDGGEISDELLYLWRDHVKDPPLGIEISGFKVKVNLERDVLLIEGLVDILQFLHDTDTIVENLILEIEL